MSSDELGPEVTRELGYLLKHAHLHLEALATRELAPLGLLPRDVGVLRVLASREPTSQQEIARLLSVDRTTMVALIDALEIKGAVSRTPSTDDRRRNVVALTASGSTLLAKAQAATKRADEHFLEPLSGRSAQQLRAVSLATE
jgi:DNA-binding MarR family transcriptional regulator